ncbi:MULTISPECIES: DUF4881 domain-containing protein [unclassified Desulfovibrio]|uniref:DUF4881 domain-containing protein n=1 Tax=unclassified Desulfovibrio TaxID=2593640 RepID=UPI000F5F0622|nr:MULTISPECIES: DUF4881 domain-containing protein [unclassified Desulfovibrio]RRD69794.1 DUF4881 domain-containing protein [Desulfovibrio sp. OH1209_COT-279]RRD86405.1 DUF4881 domain-containing protein [Desulfovibrio sp. OH1186_COT-070]
MKVRSLLLTLALAFSVALLAGCEFDGGVEQGRCVAFDDQVKTISIVVDVTLDQFNPHYSGGMHTFKLPENPIDMGPVPSVGGLLMINLDKANVQAYDAAAGSVREIPVEFTDVEKNVGSDHPKVKGKTFPVIDKEKQTVTVYSSRLKALATFKVPAEEQSQPSAFWTLGDEMRIAFRNATKGQAGRVMNITKTNIFKR